MYAKRLKMVWDATYWEGELNKNNWILEINTIINFHEFEMIHG
jgi:hypothetical protein